MREVAPSSGMRRFDELDKGCVEELNGDGRERESEPTPWKKNHTTVTETCKT